MRIFRPSHNRLERTLHTLKQQARKSFVPYVTAGHPDAASTKKIVLALEQAGADAVELGIPFSDPMADGKTIQASSQKALAGGMTLAKALKLVRELRKKTQIPLVFMTYYNVVYQFGLKAFCRQAAKAGVDGVIVPDLPVEESGPLGQECNRNKLCLVFLLAPTSSKERMKLITHKSRGFVYYVSLTGITGVRKALPKDLRDKIKLLDKLTAKPVLVGFGIAEPAQARQVAQFADGVIVGSALVSLIDQHAGKASLIPAVKRFSASLARAVHSADR